MTTFAIYRERPGRFIEVFRSGTGAASAPLPVASGSTRGDAKRAGIEQPEAVSYG